MNRIKDYFTVQPVYPAVFQVSSSYLSGISFSAKEGKIKRYFILPLEVGLIDPAFDRRNIKAPSPLAEKFKQGLQGFESSREKISLLIPESCLRVFVFAFDSLPALEKERDKLLRWRVKKLIPLMPEDARLSYQMIKMNGSVKILVSLARASVIQEYETLLSGLGMKVGALSSPTLNLLNLIEWEKEGDALLANIEEDSISLVGIINSQISLFRSKPLMVERQRQIPEEQKIENIFQEVENTLHFLEDREKRAARSLWLRASLEKTTDGLAARLRERLPFPVQSIDSPLLSRVPLREREMLTPLIGQIT